MSRGLRSGLLTFCSARLSYKTALLTPSIKRERLPGTFGEGEALFAGIVELYLRCSLEDVARSLVSAAVANGWPAKAASSLCMHAFLEVALPSMLAVCQVRFALTAAPPDPWLRP